MIPLIWKGIKFIIIKVYILIYFICFFKKPHFHDWGEWKTIEHGFRVLRWDPECRWPVRIERRSCKTCTRSVTRENDE